jgi:hypothetical protein
MLKLALSFPGRSNRPNVPFSLGQMSAIAPFVKLSKTDLDGLRDAATPKKPLFGRPRDLYHDYLRLHGKEVADYRWSGYVLATLLPYLEERHQIRLMTSEYEALADSLTKTRGAAHFIFTNELKTKNLDLLDSLSVSEEQLRDYYNEFNETNEPQIGKPMLDGVKVFRQALSQVDESSVVVFAIS